MQIDGFKSVITSVELPQTKNAITTKEELTVVVREGNILVEVPLSRDVMQMIKETAFREARKTLEDNYKKSL